MKDYHVEFSDSAEAELFESIIWGIEVWGERATYRWARELRDKVRMLLGSHPLGQPFAPESEFSEVDIRQLTVGRYRVLFEIDSEVVNILHIRGAFTGKR